MNHLKNAVELNRQLADLVSLHKAGSISDEEFAARKAALIDNNSPQPSFVIQTPSLQTSTTDGSNRWQWIVALWWLITWRTALGSTLIGSAIGFVVGLIIGFIGAALHWPRDTITATITLITFLFAIPAAILWSVYVIHQATEKTFSKFRVVLKSA